MTLAINDTAPDFEAQTIDPTSNPGGGNSCELPPIPEVPPVMTTVLLSSEFSLSAQAPSDRGIEKPAERYFQIGDLDCYSDCKGQIA